MTRSNQKPLRVSMTEFQREFIIEKCKRQSGLETWQETDFSEAIDEWSKVEAGTYVSGDWTISRAGSKRAIWHVTNAKNQNRYFSYSSLWYAMAMAIWLKVADPTVPSQRAASHPRRAKGR